MKKTILALFAFTLCITTSQAQAYPEMVTVPGGTFTMGDEHGDGYSVEKPTHRVSLSTYKLSKTEVTVAQYRKFCESVGFTMPKEPSWSWQDNHPIVNVSYQDALFFCEWLSEETGKRYNLPTEAQWEFAAKGGNQSRGYKFSGGNSILFVGWFKNSSGGKTHEVATKKPNELGLYDMSGNVWEWCLDWYDGDYYASSPSNNPKGPNSGADRVARGGSFKSSANGCRVADRSNLYPSGRENGLGFRVALSQ